MFKGLLTGIFCLLGCAVLLATAAEPFSWQTTVTPLKNQRYKVRTTCRIAPQAYLYSNATKVKVKLTDGKEYEIKSPPPAANKDGELIYKSGSVSWTMFAQQAPVGVTAEFQGCTEENGEAICLLPQTLTLWSKDKSGKTAGVPAENSSQLPPELTEALQKFAPGKVISGIIDLAELEKFVQQGSDALAANSSEKSATEAPEMGFWAVLLLVVLGGLGLNLTPCVLPMIPINLAIIGANASAAGRWRGFRRGAAYGLGITLTYGALGVLAVLTGSRFGELNSSSIFNWIIAAIFAVLALGMAGVYELDLAKIGNLFRRKSNRPARQLPPEITAFTCGIGAALLAGACVAPVIITVILLAANLSAVGNYWGLLLPFALGAAMALPWPLLGAGIAVLPKPGAWMTKVKYIFSVLIMLMALYYAYLGWTLRSGAFDQQQEINRLTSELNAAAAQKQSVLIDCWASWCKNCHALDKVLTSDEGKAILQRYQIKLIKFQAEKLNDPAVRDLLDHYRLVGLPSLILLPGKGKH